jgi:N-acetylglucosaminyldiphosphoundecaprenol N-acetyl-beta-D-mannosaminyltransferase
MSDEIGRRTEFLVVSSTSGALLADLDDGFSEIGIRHRRRAHHRRSLCWMTTIRGVQTLRRLTDFLLAAFLITILSPALVPLLVGAHVLGGGVRKRQRLGRWATRFDQYEFRFLEVPRFSHLKFLNLFPALFNILKGDMSFVGPRAVSPDETLTKTRTAWKRYDLRPGLLSLWWLRKRANIAYNNEIGLDIEYVETNTLWGDLGIASRAIPAIFLGGGGSNAPIELKFLGVRIDNLTMADASEKIVTWAQTDEPVQVCFVNADCVNIAFADHRYRAILSEAELVLADGIGVRIAGAILNQNIRENINGTDMLPYLCKAMEIAGLRLYLLGGRSGVPEGAAALMIERYPLLKVAGIRHGYFNEEEQLQVIQDIVASKADVLLVALGVPRQDKWIAEHMKELGVKVAIGVGGLLDFYSGRIPRAPIWMRELGMEWLYRFWQEPRRMWRRYFMGNVLFLYRVVRERMRTVRKSHNEGIVS